MHRHYSGIDRAAQRAIEAAGGSAVYPEMDTLYPLLEQHGIWTVEYPDATRREECYYWVWLHANVLARREPGRRTGILNTLPTGAKLLEIAHLLPSREPSQLLHITAEDEQKYMLSKKRDFAEEPEILFTESGSKEVLVPGWRRAGSNAIFIDGFGAGRPGFEPLFVLFVYDQDGTHAIYFLSPEERNDLEKRYTHLHLKMGSNEYNSLDGLLEEHYHITIQGNSTEGRVV